MKRRSLAAVTAVLTTAAVVPATVAVAATSPAGSKTALSSSAVSTSGLSIGNAAPAAAPMSLTLQLPQRNSALMNRLQASGTVVSTAQYRKLFGASDASLAKVVAYAKANGMTVDQVDAAGSSVMVHTTVSRVNSAFGVSVRRASRAGSSGLSAVGTPVVPAALGLSGISGLSTVRKSHVNNAKQANSSRPTLARAAAKSKITGTPRGRISAGASNGSTDCSPYWGDNLQPSALVYAKESNLICGYQPKDLAKIQGVAGAQQNAPAIGLLLWGNDPNMLAETNFYMKEAGYPALTKYTSYPAATNAQIQATQPGCSPYESGAEQSIDVQSSHSVSPNSPIYYYGAKSCTDADLTSELSKMVNEHKVSTISMSFGQAYDQGMTPAQQAAWDRPLQQASLTGISTFASSGDSGDNSDAAGNDLANGNPDNKPHIGYPASSSYTTAVGGTSVGLSSTGALTADVGWENAYYQQKSLSSTAKTRLNFPTDGAGGGVSQVSKIPLWQKGKVTTSAVHRAVPDVAGLSNPYTGFTVRDTAYQTDANGNPVLSSATQQYDTYGGTSLASPMVAATVALAKAYNKVTIGNAAPRLYALLGSSALRDINGVNTAGVFVPTTKYPAGIVISVDGHPVNSLGRQENLVTAKGWDNVTGVGELNGLAFIKAFK